jgi:EmrB/QacA subfamily drug resistance transporter
MTTKQKWVLGLTSLASLMVALDVLVVSTALSTIRAQLHASVGQLEWTVNAYALSFAVLLMTAAAIGDRFGRRRLFAVGLGLFVAASVACALASGIGWLITARAFQGAAGAIVAPLAISLLSAAFPPEHRGKALGIFGGVTGLAVLGGPVVGGAITQGLAWQWVFWLNVPIGLIAIPLVLARMQESHGPRAQLDVAGLALVTGAALGLVWGLVRGNSVGWGSAEVLGTLVGGVALAIAFVIVELRVSEPMLPMRLFCSRAFAIGNAANFLMYGALFSAVFFMAQFQQVVLHQSPFDAGLRLLPWTGAVFLVAPLAGAMVDRIGERPFVVVGLLLQAAGLAWVALIARDGLPFAQMIPPLVIAGAGMSMAVPAAQNAIMSSVAVTDIGKASGTFSTTRQLGAAFGLAIVVAVFTGAGSYATPASFSAGFGPAIGVSAALSLAGAIAGLALRTRPAPARAETTIGAETTLAAEPAAAAV